MDSRARHKTTLDLLQEKGELSVVELSERTGTSPMTVRRDLQVLEPEGVLRRVHAGAISVASNGDLPPYPVREKRDTVAKQRIGEAAASMTWGLVWEV